MAVKKAMLLFIALFVSLGWVREVEAAGAISPRLGVNDKLTEIKAVSVKDIYYVPLRDLAQELNLTLTGLTEGIEVAGSNSSLRLQPEHKTAKLQNGNTVALGTFLQDGRLMVPLRMTTYLGYTITFKPDQYLLRVLDHSAQLDEAAFVDKFKDELKPRENKATAAGTTAQSGKIVYLTFDDGPSDTTPQLLDILDKYEVKATFFMIGPHMNSYPAQVKRIVQEEHGLGLHGLTHRKEKFYASPAAALAEMNGDNAILKKITGNSTTLIRTPYGSKPYFTKSFRDKVLSQGYHLWDWNVDSEDWKYKEESGTVYTSVMNQLHKKQKASVTPVILMHDQKATLKVLPRILESLKKEGYQFKIITGDLEPVNFWKDIR